MHCKEAFKTARRSTVKWRRMQQSWNTFLFKCQLIFVLHEVYDNNYKKKKVTKSQDVSQQSKTSIFAFAFRLKFLFANLGNFSNSVRNSLWMLLYSKGDTCAITKDFFSKNLHLISLPRRTGLFKSISGGLQPAEISSNLNQTHLHIILK